MGAAVGEDGPAVVGGAHHHDGDLAQVAADRDVDGEVLGGAERVPVGRGEPELGLRVGGARGLTVRQVAAERGGETDGGGAAQPEQAAAQAVAAAAGAQRAQVQQGGGDRAGGVHQSGAALDRGQPGPVDPAGPQHGRQRDQPGGGEPAGGGVVEAGGVEQPGGQPAADRDLGERRVQRVAERDAVQQVAGAAERQGLDEVGEALRGRVEERPAAGGVQPVGGALVEWLFHAGAAVHSPGCQTPAARRGPPPGRDGAGGGTGGAGQEGRMRPRQPPDSTPRSSTKDLNRSRSPRTRRSIIPMVSAACSANPCGS